MKRHEAVRILTDHGSVRQFWKGGGYPPELPGEVALLRSCKVEQALRNMEPAQRQLLEALFFKRESPLWLCNTMSVSPATLYRMRGEALDHFGKAYLDLGLSPVQKHGRQHGLFEDLHKSGTLD